MFADLVTAARRAERVMRKFLAREASASEVIAALGGLSAQTTRGQFWFGPGEDGIDWSGKVHALVRSLKVAEGRRAQRRAVVFGLRELGPLLATAKVWEEAGV